MSRPAVYSVTAHLGTGGGRKLPDVPRSDALAFMRAVRQQDAAATFTVEGPHRPPVRRRLAALWN